MKVFGVFIFILLLATAQNLLIDMLLGYKFTYAVSHLLNPFWVIEAGEIIMLVFFFLLTIGHQILLIRKNKANKQNGSS
ncbi:hypothetical protein [Bacillus benzoevorans]|uniref:Uncharacterized protein n=1 Tax=Bacillus benzoevorans TaxID=1456 RepID=A0A7X0LWJ0_9BACI|nr:hypothetical protein [Bacillus benzoevorans]MBB6447116.1 hypothetical protein [Bacillus benzoevorans]